MLEDGPALTRPGTVLGTPAYMAPEQVNAEGVDHRADLFSLGCVLYRLSTGKPAFRGTDPLATLTAVITQQPPPPRELNPELPPALADLIVRLLAKDPAGRPPSAQAVAEALQDIAGERTEALPALRAPAPGAAPMGWPRRRLVALLALLVLAGLVMVVAVYRIRTDKGELVIEAHNEDVEVIVKKGGEVVRILDTRTGKSIELKSGEYELELKGQTGGLALDVSKVTLKRGQVTLATIERKEPGAGKPVKLKEGEVLVAKDGSGQYDSLRQAVLEAKAGATIRVRPGKYSEEEIVVHRNLTILGDGPAKDVAIEFVKDSPFGFHLLAERGAAEPDGSRSQGECRLGGQRGSSAGGLHVHQFEQGQRGERLRVCGRPGALPVAALPGSWDRGGLRRHRPAGRIGQTWKTAMCSTTATRAPGPMATDRCPCASAASTTTRGMGS